MVALSLDVPVLSNSSYVNDFPGGSPDPAVFPSTSLSLYVLSVTDVNAMIPFLRRVPGAGDKLVTLITIVSVVVAAVSNITEKNYVRYLFILTHQHQKRYTKIYFFNCKLLPDVSIYQ